MADKETSLRPTPTDFAILQSIQLKSSLSPPLLPMPIDEPRVWVAVDDTGREIEEREGPVEIEMYGEDA